MSARDTTARDTTAKDMTRSPAPLLTEIDHVAIAVRDLDAAVEWYEKAFGAEVVHREVVEKDQVEEVLLAVSDSYIQLVTPSSDDSPVARYWRPRGRDSITSVTG